MIQTFGEKQVKTGINATACSFYSSQGRKSNIYQDYNETIIDEVAKEKDISSLEMETFHIYDLAENSNGKLIASATCLVLAQRKEKTFIDLDLKKKMEKEMGKAALDAIIKVELNEVMKEFSWN
jgi:uridine phosphorylase